MEYQGTSYIKTDGGKTFKEIIEQLDDITFTRKTQDPWINYSHINKTLTEEQLINLTKPTMNKQHKVVVFTVKRNEKNEIISSEFYKEGWIEVNIDQSINLLAAKQLKIPVDLFDSIVVKKIYEVTL